MRTVLTWAALRHDSSPASSQSSVPGSKSQLSGSPTTPSSTPSAASQAASTASCTSCRSAARSRIDASASSGFATRSEPPARPVQSRPGAPAMMPSKTSGKRCAAFIACRPPAEQPFQYE